MHPDGHAHLLGVFCFRPSVGELSAAPAQGAAGFRDGALGLATRYGIVEISKLNDSATMNHPFHSDDDGPFGLNPEHDSLGGKLRTFHNGFDSSIRAILRDCLYRIVEEEDTCTLQILCPNQAVLKRLSQKKGRIRYFVMDIWRGKINRAGLCLNKDGEFSQLVTVDCTRGQYYY
jgi:hypothetical protein